MVGSTQVYYLFLFLILKIAVPDLLDASRDADILIFVVPHQFINRLCDQMAGNIKSTAIGLSLIKVSHYGHQFLEVVTIYIKINESLLIPIDHILLILVLFSAVYS